MQSIASYGVVQEAHKVSDEPPWLAEVLESLERVGFALLANQLEQQKLEDMRRALDDLAGRQAKRFGGVEALEAIGEAGQVRAPCMEDPLFWELVTLPDVNAVVERLLGPAAIVMQQNGVVMPPAGERHQQQRWHRDLPYQAWVSTSPLAIGALCALDAFNSQSGGTAFLPGSHRFPRFPSEPFIQSWEHGIEAPAGSVILFDAMVFHRGGLNSGRSLRRAVNTLFGVPLLAQQVDLMPPEGAPELLHRRCR